MADESSTSEVAARYAQALFDLAAGDDEVSQIEADLIAVRRLAAESADLRALLASPRYTAAQQRAAVAELAKRAGFRASTTKFLGLLAANRRLRALLPIIDAFRRLAARRRGQVLAEVTTALAMDTAQHERLADALSKALGRAPQIETRVDPAILGGVKVKVGSRLYDASLKSKLDSLKLALARA